MKIFIIISLSMHLITLLFILILFKRFRSLQASNLPNMKELLDQTLFAIREENERLYKHLNDLKLTSKSEPLKAEEHQIVQPVNRNSHNENEPVQQQQPKNSFEALFNPMKEDEYKPSLQGQILQLHERGLSHDEIAQTLNCGKTEVELILRFQQKG